MEEERRDEDNARSFIVPAGIDLRTGKSVPLPPKKRGEGGNAPEKNGVGFFRVYSKNLSQLLSEREPAKKDGQVVMIDRQPLMRRVYSLSDFGLLCAMMAFAEWGTNRLVHPETKQPLTISDFAALIGMNRKHLTQTIPWLESKGLIKTLKQRDGSKYIMVNAQLMWYGKEMRNIDEQFHAFNTPNEDGEYVPTYKPEFPVVYKERSKKEGKEE